MKQPRHKLFERLEVLTLEVEECISGSREDELRTIINARESVLREILSLDQLTTEETARLVQLQDDQTRILGRMKAEHAELERGLIQIHTSRHGRRAYRKSA